MPIADLTPSNTPTLTDEKCVTKILRNLISAIRQNRDTLSRITKAVANAPGGQAGCLTALGAEQAEAIAILDKLVTLLNTHKATGVSDVTNPLT